MNRECSSILRSCTLLVLLVAAGCYESVPPPKLVGEARPAVRPSAALPAGRYEIVGRSVQGSPMVAQVFGNGPDITFVLATIHGNEPAGTALVRQLAQHLEQNPHLSADRTVVLLPVANPDGMVMSTRQNANRVDLNRNFQTANRVNNAESGKTALSEPETQAIHAIIDRYSPDCIVSIHSPIGCIDYDGPAYLLATRMAQYCNLPTKTLGAKTGSLGSYAGVTLGIPTITLELPPGESDRDSETLWLRYGKALLAAITYPEKFD